MEIIENCILKMKKPHPCGGYRWRVLRSGMDIRMQCETCGHVLLLSRTKVEKQIRAVENSVQEKMTE